MASKKNAQASSTIRERVLAVFDELPPKQQQLAQYVMGNEATIAFVSAHDVAQTVGTSAATVVRFARAIGYEGYTELQDHIRSTITGNRTASQTLQERIAQGGFGDNLLTAIAEVNTRNIYDTLEQVSLETLDQAVDALLNASSIYIVGGGMSAAAVVMAQHSLTMLGLHAQAIVNGGLSQTLTLSHLTEKDVVIVVSIWRYLRDTMKATTYAKEKKATTIALTDNLLSPVAREADYVFVASTERAAHSRSLTGMISLIDLINAAIVTKNPDASMHAVKHIEDLYFQQGKLIDDTHG